MLHRLDVATGLDNSRRHRSARQRRQGGPQSERTEAETADTEPGPDIPLNRRSDVNAVLHRMILTWTGLAGRAIWANTSSRAPIKLRRPPLRTAMRLA